MHARNGNDGYSWMELEDVQVGIGWQSAMQKIQIVEPPRKSTAISHSRERFFLFY